MIHCGPSLVHCGQVYRVRCREGGEVVALKVQRPDMIRAVSQDLYILRKYMHAVEAIKGVLMECGVLGQRKQFDVDLLDTFANASYFELDYQHEVRT